MCFLATAPQVPGRQYSYKVAHGPAIMAFQAPPPAGRKEGFQFLAYGDMGDPHHRQAKAPGYSPAAPQFLRPAFPVLIRCPRSSRAQVLVLLRLL